MLTYDQLLEHLSVFIVEAKSDIKWLEEAGAGREDVDLFSQRVTALEQIKSIVREYSELAGE